VLWISYPGKKFFRAEWREKENDTLPEGVARGATPA
jgi:hypothetical protein